MADFPPFKLRYLHCSMRVPRFAFEMGNDAGQFTAHSILSHSWHLQKRMATLVSQ